MSIADIYVETLKDKKVAFVGMGVANTPCAEFLAKKGVDVYACDRRDRDYIGKETCDRLESFGVKFSLGDNYLDILPQMDIVFRSHGILPFQNPWIGECIERGQIVTTEMEVFFKYCPCKIFAVTGSNGKTTTTTLIAKMLEAAGNKVYLGGNIGKSYAYQVATEHFDYYVLEISSFQLETIDQFRPKVSAILNITEDHLNRHHTMEEYIRVKELITRNQGPEDVCVLNYEDEVLRKFGENIVPKVVYFSSLRKLDQGIYLDGDQIILKTEKEEIPIVKTGELKILGRHNHENVMAAAAMAYYAGVSVESIHKSVCEFVAVPHRIEYVTEKNGVAYYNDSKGTNPDAAIKGIQAMNRPTLLIGGGYDKESSYDEWIQSFDGKVRYLVLIGQTKEKIKAAAERLGFTDIILCEDLKEAVQKFAVPHFQ